MAISLAMICAGVLPIPIVYLLRRFQLLKVDLDIHQGSIRRNETTASTKEMIDEDDVSEHTYRIAIYIYIIFIAYTFEKETMTRVIKDPSLILILPSLFFQF